MCVNLLNTTKNKPGLSQILIPYELTAAHVTRSRHQLMDSSNQSLVNAVQQRRVSRRQEAGRV